MSVPQQLVRLAPLAVLLVASTGHAQTAPSEKAAADTCAAFELDECVRLNEALLQSPALTSEQRAAAYQRLASAFAAMEDVSQSSRYWRLLLRLRPDLELPAETSPKIMMVFRSVQVEEARLRETLEEERRRRTVEAIDLSLEAPAQHQGGLPLKISGTLTDPEGGVTHAWLRHRLGGQEQFTATPLQPRDGRVSAELPGAATAGGTNREMEVFMEVQDAEGRVLKTAPADGAPLRIQVLAGEVPTTPFYQQPLFRRVALLSAGIGVPAALLTTAVVVVGFIGITGVTLWLSSIQPGGLQGSQYQEVP